MTLCTFGPPSERKRRWILKFEDADVADMHFTGEAEAMHYFERHSTAYTCTLFVTAETPTSSCCQEDGDACGPFLDQQREIARLRSALVQIEDVSFEVGDPLGSCINIARAALGVKKRSR